MRTTASEYLLGASLGLPRRARPSLVASSLCLPTFYFCVVVLLFAFYLFVFRCVEMARVAVGATFADRISGSEVRDRWTEEPYPEEQRSLLWYNNLFCLRLPLAAVAILA